MRILALEHDADDACPASDHGGGRESAVERREAFARLARDEASRLWDLVQEGVVRETYFRTERSAAVLVLECRDPAEAEAALASLPFVRAGLIRFEVIGLSAYPGFARLFETADTPRP